MKKERMFLVFVVVATIAYLTIMSVKFTSVGAEIPVVEASEITKVPVVNMSLLVYEPTLLETPVIEVLSTEVVETKSSVLHEEAIAGFALIADKKLSSEEYAKILYSEKELYLAAKLVHCEAGVDSWDGKIAVFNVVLNRAEHWNKNLYGGPTLEGVILHKLGTHVFSCVDDKELWAEEPCEEDYEVVYEVLSGNRPLSSDYLYYYNPDVYINGKPCKGTPGVKYDKEKIGMHLFGIEE